MKYLFPIILLIILTGCPGKKKMQNQDSIETISIDIRKFKQEADISSIIDTSYFEIIPLETNDECLIAEVKNIYFSNNKIVIYDKQARGAYIFNRDGSYHAKVRAVGQGPGEYPDWVNDIAASENFIMVLTPPGIMLYDYDGKFVKTVSLEHLWGMNIFTFDEMNYFLVNDWSMNFKHDNKVLFHLFRLDTKNNRVHSYLPFSMKDIDNRRGWSLNTYCNVYDNQALIYYGSIDTIYNVTPKGDLSPRYIFDIVYNKLPDELRTGDGTTALKTAQKNGYVMGVVNVVETSRYLFLKLNAGKYVIYDKKEKETIFTGRDFRIPPFWNMGINIDFSFKEGDNIVYYITGGNAYGAKKDIEEEKVEKRWTKGDGTNPFEKEFFKVLKNVKDEEDNPILFVFQMKN
jgi:hypothetical protein